MAQTLPLPDKIVAQFERWGLHHGYLHPPRHLGTDDASSAPLHGTLWFHVKWDDVTSRLPPIARVLQLLDTLARSDDRAWTRMLLRLWPTNDIRLWLLRREQQRQQLPRDNGATSRIGLAIAWSSRSPCLLSLRDGVLAASTGGAAIPLRVTTEYSGKLPAALMSLELLLPLCETDTPYRLVSVCVFEDDLKASSLERLSVIARHGVEITTAPRLACELTVRKAPVFVKALQALMPSCRSRDTVSTQIVRLATRTSAHGTPSHRCLLSAIGDSRSVQHVDVTLGRRVDDDFVRWLAFALCSAYARHNLRKLTLHGSLEDTAAFSQSFQAVVMARDPVVELFPELRCSIENYASTRVAASRFYLVEPQKKPFIECPELTELRVLSNTDKWWSVLLPAWGRAWVHTRDAVVTMVPAATAACEACGPLSIPCLELDGGSMAMVSGLAAMGHGVTHLKLCIPRGTTVPVNDRVDWRVLHNAFPRLTSLHLRNVHVDGLAPLYDAWWSDLKTLTLDEVEVETVGASHDDDDWLQLLHTLADPTHGLTKTLRELSVTMGCLGRDNMPLLDAALAMLRCNTRLRWFQLTLPSRAVYTADVRDAIRTQRGTPVQERCAPLGMREKCAVCSVLAGPCDGSIQYALDSHVLATIFEFAAVCTRRHVEFDELCE